MRFAIAIDFFDHQPLLIDLDREDRSVAILVFVFGNRAIECFAQMPQPMRKDVGEPHDQRRGELPLAQSLHNLVKVDFADLVHVGPHYDMAGVIDREVALAPSVDLIKVDGIRHRPTIRTCRFAGGCRDFRFHFLRHELVCPKCKWPAREHASHVKDLARTIPNASRRCMNPVCRPRSERRQVDAQRRPRAWCMARATDPA